MFQNKGSQNVHDRPFPNHCDRKGKAQIMMISTIDEEMLSQPEVKPDLDQMGQKVQGLFKFKMAKWILI